MKLFKYDSDTFARIVFVFTFLLSVSSGVYGQENNGWGEDAWGAPDTAAVAEKVYTLDDYSKTVRNGKRVYTIFVKNVSDEVMILRGTRLKSIKSGNTEIDRKSVKINILEKGTIRVLPGEQKNLITVTAKPESEDLKFNWGYTYNTIYAAEPVAGKPTLGLDYALYSEVDTVKQKVTYYMKNFSDKSLVLKSIKESDDTSYQFFRSAVYTGGDKSSVSYSIKKGEPKMPAVLKPGADFVVRIEAYTYLNMYEYADLYPEVLFHK